MRQNRGKIDANAVILYSCSTLYTFSRKGLFGFSLFLIAHCGNCSTLQVLLSNSVAYSPVHTKKLNWPISYMTSIKNGTGVIRSASRVPRCSIKKKKRSCEMSMLAVIISNNNNRLTLLLSYVLLVCTLVKAWCIP